MQLAHGRSLLGSRGVYAHGLLCLPSLPHQVQEAEASKLVDNGQIDGRMTATLSYPASACGSGSLTAGAVGHMEADLRHDGLWPVTHFIATGTK